MRAILVKSHNLASVFTVAEYGIVCSTRQSSPRGWWSLKFSEGRILREKLSQRDKYLGGISHGSLEKESYVTNRTY